MRSVLLALSLGIALSAPAGAAAPVRDNLIVPGMRVGPIALGMSEAELQTAAGVPPQTQKQGNETIYSWGEIVAQISGASPGVDLITVNDTRYQTAEHIHVGLAALAVVTVLGQPPKVTTPPGTRNYEYDGMTVVTRNNLVVQIRVQK